MQLTLLEIAIFHLKLRSIENGIFLFQFILLYLRYLGALPTIYLPT